MRTLASLTLGIILTFTSCPGNPEGQETCPEGTHHLYPKTDSGPCVDDWMK